MQRFQKGQGHWVTLVFAEDTSCRGLIRDNYRRKAVKMSSDIWPMTLRLYALRLRILLACLWLSRPVTWVVRPPGLPGSLGFEFIFNYHTCWLLQAGRPCQQPGSPSHSFLTYSNTSMEMEIMCMESYPVHPLHWYVLSQEQASQEINEQ